MKKLVHTPVSEYIASDYFSRFKSKNPSDSECINDSALKIVAGWKKTGSFVVANAGAFDLLGLNHIRGLIQCRVIGAMSLLGVDEISNNPELAQTVYETAASEKIKLLVSIDTNRAVEDNKSRNEANGGSVKPIFDWYTRAMMVASQSMPIPNSTLRIPLADHITRHGPGACSAHQEDMCWHEDTGFSLASLDPDLLIIKNVSNIGTSLDQYQVNIALIDEHFDAFTDPLVGGEISSSSTIKRIRS
jgi:hypothetical protein